MTDSPEFRERQRRVAEVAEDFDAYAGEQVARFNGLSDFLTDSLGMLGNLEQVNAALEASGRPDLAISEPVEMMHVDSPEEIFGKCNNFAMNFLMYTDRIEPPQGSHSLAQLVPITKEQLEALKNFPKVDSYEEEEEVVESGDFVLPFQSHHFSKPAFLRMLILFPDFTKDLVTRMSAPENRGEELAFKPELFVAWQLMSRLVDENDIYVKERATTDMPYAAGS